MATTELRRVLGGGLSREDFRESAAALGMTKQREWNAQSGRSYEEAWANEQHTRALNYVEDLLSGMALVVIRAGNPEALAEELGREIRLYAPDELVDTAWDSDDPKEQVQTLNRLALTFPEYDEEVASIFERFLTGAPNPLLRSAALQVVARTMWDQLFSLVQEAAEHDPDPDVRRDAADVVNRWTAARNK